MNDENWLVKAFREGRLDKIVEKANRDYDEGRALGTLEPSPVKSGSQPVFRSIHRMVRWLKGGYELGYLPSGLRARRYVRSGVVEIQIPWSRTTWAQADSSHWSDFDTKPPNVRMSDGGHETPDLK